MHVIMKSAKTIKLDNNYYFKIINNINEINNIEDNIIVDANNINTNKILQQKKVLLKIDFVNLQVNEYKKILSKLLSLKEKVVKRKIEIGNKEENDILLGYIVGFDKNKKLQNDFISAINAIFYNTKYERYNYIYDTVCDYLDSFFYGKNLCEFKNNKCGEKRNTNLTIGCCRHYKNKLLGPLLSNNFVPCEHLKEDYTCGAKCIGCKLFTCDYLQKKGVRFKIKDILLLDVFFNPLQKYFIKTMVFTPKDKIIKRLIKL